MLKSQTMANASSVHEVGRLRSDNDRTRSTVVDDSSNLDNTNFKAAILNKRNMWYATTKVISNHGSAGIDGLTVEELEDYLWKDNNGKKLRTRLTKGSYRPKPVKRVTIPKANGGTRKLGVPTAVDRMVQQAAAQVLSRKFESIFSDSSYGFRPNRSAHDAIKQCVSLVDQGYRFVIDLDLKAYFDTVDHDLLIKFVEKEIPEPWVTTLIRRFLTSGAMIGNQFEASQAGTPQGGPISPLLGNIYLNELDQELMRRGLQFVRYADDCNIFVKSRRAGERVLKNITKFLEGKLKLTVNQEKTQVVKATQMSFLGFSLRKNRDGAYPVLTLKTQKRIKAELKALTKRSRGISRERVFVAIRQKMVGWLNYYGIARMKSFIGSLDSWLRARIRQFYWTQWKRIRTRIAKLRQLGASMREAIRMASTRRGPWRTVHLKLIQVLLTNKRLEADGLINLSKALRQIQGV